MPFTFTCPIDDCVTVEHNRFDLVTHMRRRHGDAAFTANDAGPCGKFETQAAAQGGRIYSARIMCRGCMRDTERTDTDPMFRHCDDGTPACLDPETLKPYAVEVAR